MGTLQASAVLTVLFNFPTRIRLATKNVKLDTLGLSSALSVPRMDWSLPKKDWLLAFLAIGISHGPAALWASALTPIPTEHSLHRGSTLVPRFTGILESIWGNHTHGGFDLKGCHVQVYNDSHVTNCPVPYYQNALLNTAREATPPDDANRNHSKLDSPQWTYRGRSYGAGSSLGLGPISEIPENFQLTEYSFEENGYVVSAKCEHPSPHLDLKLESRVHQADLGVFRLRGSLPNMNGQARDPVINWCRPKRCEHPDDVPMFAWYAESNDQNHHKVGIAATVQYASDFDNTLCSLNFAPTNFTVQANVANRSIIVTRQNNSTTDFDSKGHLAASAVLSLRYLSRMTASLYLSVLGEAMQYAVNTTRNSDSFRDEDPSKAGLAAIEASFEAILDDILGIYGGSHIIIANSTISTPIKGQFKSFRIGDSHAHYLTLLLNLVILSGIAIEATRTGFWGDLPRYDIMDFKSTVTAASFGGTAISKKIQQQQKDNELWEADSGDRKLGKIRVCLIQGESEEPRIVHQGDSNALLTEDEAGGDGREMDDETASLKAGQYKGATVGWSPVGLDNDF